MGFLPSTNRCRILLAHPQYQGGKVSFFSGYEATDWCLMLILLQDAFSNCENFVVNNQNDQSVGCNPGTSMKGQIEHKPRMHEPLLASEI